MFDLKNKEEDTKVLILAELGIFCPHCRRRQIRENSIQPITSTNPKEEHPNWSPGVAGIFSCEFCEEELLVTLPPAIKRLFPKRKERIRNLRNR